MNQALQRAMKPPMKPAMKRAMKPPLRRCAAAPACAAALACVAALAAGCASAPPTRFHTLLDAPAAPATRPVLRALAWQLAPVTVPAQVDQPQLVARAGDGTLALLEHERWVAPLADELHAALAEKLAQAFGPASADPRGWRVQVEVQRFESLPGRAARIDATWSLRRGDAAAVTCRSAIEQPVGPGWPALAAGHRQALARLADDIVKALAGEGRAPECP